MIRRAVLAAAAAALVVGACAPSRPTLPDGAGTPAGDAGPALAGATAACRAIQSLTAGIAISGSVTGTRVRGRLDVGVVAPSSVRLEALASFGPPLFVFVAQGTEASVWLPGDGRLVSRANAAAVLDAVAGVPLEPSALVLVLTGCAPEDADPASARAFGDAWRVVPSRAGIDTYLHREASGWRTVALTRTAGQGGRGWQAYFTPGADRVPGRVRVASAESAVRAESFDLTLTVSQVERDVPLDADVFTIRPSARTTPMTLEELRASGPLALVRGRSTNAR